MSIIKVLRKKKGMSLQQLASLLEVDESYVLDWEEEKLDEIKRIKLMCKILDADPAFLLGLTTKNNYYPRFIGEFVGDKLPRVMALVGSATSGKTTLMNHFLEQLPENKNLFIISGDNVHLKREYTLIKEDDNLIEILDLVTKNSPEVINDILIVIDELNTPELVHIAISLIRMEVEHSSKF